MPGLGAVGSVSNKAVPAGAFQGVLPCAGAKTPIAGTPVEPFAAGICCARCGIAGRCIRSEIAGGNSIVWTLRPGEAPSDCVAGAAAWCPTCWMSLVALPMTDDAGAERDDT